MHIRDVNLKCDICGARLIDLPYHLTAKGVGICSATGVEIEYEIDLDEAKAVMIKDKFGNTKKVFAYKTSGEHK